jgi:hypothetical protein
VLFFELWHDLSGVSGGERTYLAVATRQCIFLYESDPKERAFRVVKVSTLVYAFTFTKMVSM